MNKKRLDIIVIFFVVLVVLLYRRYDAFSNPQFWAEDCLIIFDQAEKYDIKSLYIPYSGYLFMLPRLFAVLYHFLHINYEYIPTFYNYTAFIGTFFVAYGLYESACYLNLKHKLLYATWFLFLPVAPDLFMVMGSLGWMTGLYLINYIFVQNEIKNNAFYYLHLVILLVISLTHPFSSLYLPILLLVLVVERKEMSVRKLVPLLVILLGGVIQSIFIAFIDTGFYRGVPGPTDHYHLLRLFSDNVNQLFFIKSGYLSFLSAKLQLILCLLIFMVLVAIFFILYQKITFKRKYVLLGAAIICFASFIKAYWPRENGVLALTNARYYFIPYTCAGWLCLLALDKKIKSYHAAAYIILFWLHSDNIKFALPNKRWKQQLREYYENKRTTLDINPDGWQYTPDKSKFRRR